MLNMPPEHGGAGLSMLGQVALEEEAGKATNGLGFSVVERGPRELLELASPEQVTRFVEPILRGEYREAWALTEPGAGSDLSGLTTTAVRDGGDWILNGEKWFVTAEGQPGVYVVAAVADGRHPLPGRAGHSRSADRAHAELPARPLRRHAPELVFEDCRVPDRSGDPRGRRRRSKEWILVERLFIAARCCGARCATRPRERLGQGARGVRGADRRVPGGLVSTRRFADRAAAARLLTYHAAHAFDTLTDRKIVHGKVSMAKLFASETAGRVADRTVQILGGRGYRLESPAARHFRELRGRPDLGGHQRDPAPDHRRRALQRGSAAYLG